MNPEKSDMASTKSTALVHLSTMPAEIRNQIYTSIFKPILRINPHRDFNDCINRDGTAQHLELTEVNHQMYAEASPVAYQRVYSLYVEHIRDSGFLDSRLRHHVKQVFLDDVTFNRSERDPKNRYAKPFEWLERCSNLEECVLLLPDCNLWLCNDAPRPVKINFFRSALEKAQRLLGHQRTEPYPFQLILAYTTVHQTKPEKGVAPVSYERTYLVNYQTEILGKTPRELQTLVTRLMEEQDGNQKFNDYLKNRPWWVDEVLRLRDREEVIERNLAAYRG